MLTHGNLVADSAGMVRVTYVAPAVVRTAYGEEESIPGEPSCSLHCLLLGIRQHTCMPWARLQDCSAH